MVVPLLIATVVFVLGITLQALIFASLLLRLPKWARWAVYKNFLWRSVAMLDLISLILLAIAILQIAVWALIFQGVGAFASFTDAFYHSAVNFTTLGYGDIVMPGTWRMLGPLEALNGVITLGLSIALLVGTVGQLREAHRDTRSAPPVPRPLHG